MELAIIGRILSEYSLRIRFSTRGTRPSKHFLPPLIISWKRSSGSWSSTPPGSGQRLGEFPPADEGYGNAYFRCLGVVKTPAPPEVDYRERLLYILY